MAEEVDMLISPKSRVVLKSPYLSCAHNYSVYLFYILYFLYVKSHTIKATVGGFKEPGAWKDNLTREKLTK